MIASAHPQQERRLAALHELDILDTEREKEFDDIAQLVADICEAPIGVVNLIDADRQWFKAETGLGVRSTPLQTSLCAHVILQDDFVEIADTQADHRMRDNPLCNGADALRFYAGAVLKGEDGLPLGTLCVLDRQPRELTAYQRRAIEVLGLQVTRLLDLRLALKRQDLLAREIDHRVKNSLAAISAIVRLQSKRSDDPQVVAALQAVQSRLAAMTALHEELHVSAQRGALDLAQFLNRLGKHLSPLLPEQVTLDVVADTVAMPSEIVSTIGMIVNEFVANAGKHGQTSGTVLIEGRKTGETYVLTCSDGGSADAAALEAIRHSRGLGSRIIAASAQSISGTADWRLGHPGLVLELAFPVGR